jgi:hypothetical protein
VELRTTEEPDYEALRKEMKARGFPRTIQGADGKAYQLPSAEYTIEIMQEGVEVRAQAAARDVVPGP